ITLGGRMTTFGLLIFGEAEELDFCGPWEVFTASSMLRDIPDQVLLIAEQPGPVRCGKGMRGLPDRTLEDARRLELLRGPGGCGARREASNTKLISWIARASATATWVTSVCTGALLLHEAGVARGRRVATHHAFEDTLEARGDVTVVRDARYVVDGNLVTSQGVSAGIRMALWGTGPIFGREHAPAAPRYI